MSLKLKDQVFGRLTVLYKTKERRNKRIVWMCKCRCGNNVKVRGDYLARGGTRSCGCLNKEKIKNLKGLKFGRWIVVRQIEKRSRNGGVFWLCECECGTIKAVYSRELISGDSRSCGCLQKEVTLKRSLIHGHSRRKSVTDEYVAWRNMIVRCNNPNRKSYKNYGGRGIAVCERWGDFRNFFKDMGMRPQGLSLDRKDNDGDYEPDNCRWATRRQQNNNKRNNRLVKIWGEVKTMTGWAEDKRCEVSCAVLRYRINHGWEPEKAII